MFDKLGKILALSRDRSKEGHLRVPQQFAEMAILYLLRDVGPRYYHTAGFWRRSVNWNDKMSHLNAREYRRFIDRVNPVEYRKLSQNKIAEKGIIEPLVVRQRVGTDTERYSLRSPEVRGVEAGKPYHVAIRIFDRGKQNLLGMQSLDFTSKISHDVVPDKPLVIGPGYTPNPNADG